MYKIISPTSNSDFNKYYHLRWELLRKPWNQPAGSEKDSLESESVHRMTVIKDKVVAVGRLHYINNNAAQIRYMAVSEEYEKRGIGSAVYATLEEEARRNNIKTIILNSRESAIGFYKKLGFNVKQKTYILFNEIQHYEMHKQL